MLEFKPLEPIKNGAIKLRPGNTYSLEEAAVSESQARNWYRMGLVEIVGEDPPPARVTTQHAVVAPATASVGHNAEEA